MNGFDATVAYTAIHMMMIEKREIIVQPCVTRPFYQVSFTSPPLPAGGQSAAPNPAAGAVTTTPSRGGGGSSRGRGASGGGGPSFSRGGGGGTRSTPPAVCKYGRGAHYKKVVTILPDVIL